MTEQAAEVELQTSHQPGATLSDVLPKVGDASGYADFMTFLTSAARLRSNFSSPAPEDVPEAHRIATGDPDRKVICIGSIAPWSGPLEYLKLAAHFEGRHEVWAVTLPGFAAGTRVPRDVQAVSQALAAAVTRCADGTSFTLVGRSSGGVFGLSAAGELHEAGVSPEAVVLIDSYQFDQLDERALQTMWQQFFFPAVLARERVTGALDLADLSSLGAYLPLCEQWRTPPLVAPTLLVRASESPEVSVDGNGQPAAVGSQLDARPRDDRRGRKPLEHARRSRGHDRRRRHGVARDGTTRTVLMARLLPPVAAVAETFEDVVGAALLGDEEAAVERAVAQRRREFATGRACARRALRSLGRPAAAIASGPRGEPLWPPGIVGSITHCAGYRGCALATTSELTSIGIDAEPHEALPDGLLASVATATERRQLRELGRQAPEKSIGIGCSSARRSASTRRGSR